MIQYLYGLFHEISHPPMRLESGGVLPSDLHVGRNFVFFFSGTVWIYSGVIVLVHRDIKKNVQSISDSLTHSFILHQSISYSNIT